MESITYLKREMGAVVLAVGSGSYEFAR